MKAIHGGIALLILLSACSGKTRPFADIELAAQAPSEAAGGPAIDGERELSDGGPAPAPESPSLVSEIPGPGGALDPSGDVSAGGNESLSCEADAAACVPPEADAGLPPVVCVPAPRDCTSTLDNDCDGRPDNTIDDVCRCPPGTTEACDEHPGFDGRGPCTAGSRTCVAGEGNVSSDWGPCDGAVGPAAEDSCAARGDDSDCDGQPGEGCSCVNGETAFCGPNTDSGVCQRGTITCANGSFGQCVGAVNPAPRNCGSPQDNDCDGRPDNTIDNFCQCIPGQGNAPCSGNANFARCGGSGRCEPCQVDADCALVSGERSSCDDGSCVQPLLALGATCEDDDECGSAFCATWFRDLDDDQQGDPLQERRTCANRQAPVPPSGFVENSDDCCDSTLAAAGQIFRGQTQFFDEPQTACPSLDPYDYDCSGTLTDQLEGGTNTNGGCGAACDGTVWLNDPPANCGQAGPTVICGFVVVDTTVSCQVRFVGGAPENIVKMCH